MPGMLKIIAPRYGIPRSKVKNGQKTEMKFYFEHKSAFVGEIICGNKHISFMLDQDQNLLGRSPADRFVYKVPVCKDVRCGYTGEVFERKYRDGCVFRDTLERDQGELSYPKIVNGKPGVYSNKENCIWHIQASSPNKWLKVIILKITYLNSSLFRQWFS